MLDMSKKLSNNPSRHTIRKLDMNGDAEADRNFKVI